jgi:hypothetical protein
MTREAFIKVLDEKGYSYEKRGNKIVVTHEGHVELESLTSLPSRTEFRNRGYVYLDSLTSLPSDVVFGNGREIYLDSLTGDFFSKWGGNIDGINKKRLLNKMISLGLFER